MRASRRPWVAALLSFVQPGAGHLYLREWSRGAVWFLLWVTTAAFATGMTSPTLSVDGLVAFLGAFFAALGGLELLQSVAIAAVTGFAVVDAYWLGVRQPSQPTDEPSCPTCGREVDLSLGFCHWCTAEFEVVEQGDQVPQ